VTTTVSWRLAIFGVFALNGLSAATWMARMPSVRDQLGIDLVRVGVLIFAVSVGSIVGLLLSAHVVHWLGGRRTIGLFLAGCGFAVAVIGIGASSLGSTAVAMLGFALFGFSSGICDVGMNVEGAAVERATGRNIMPWFHAAWSGGTVLGAGIGSAAAASGVDPAVHLGVVAVVVMAGAVVVVRWIPGADAGAAGAGIPKAGLRERLAIWFEPRTLLIGLIVLGMAFTEGSANDWLSFAMIDGRGLDNGQGALGFGIFTVAMTAGRIAGVPLLDRFGRVPVLRAAAGAALVGLAVVILVPSIPLAIAGVVAWGLGASLGFPVGMSAAADDPGRAAARVSAVATIAYCAFLIGPPLIGAVSHRIGILNALWIVFALTVMATLAIPAARAPRPAPTSGREIAMTR
jgi:MFS family permease